MNKQKLSDAIFKIAVAFIVLHADVHLGRLNILPDWLGYGMIVGALEALGEEEPSAELLQPLGYLLAGWSFGEWGLDFFGHTLNGYGIGVILSVVRVYFQFQLLTNLADIAGTYAPQHRERILRLRSLMTVVLTGYTLYSVTEPTQGVTVAVAAIYCVAAVLTCKVLVGLQNAILPPMSQGELTFGERMMQNAEAYDQTK